MSDQICCKVARILSDRELVINAGSSQGVREEMMFNVMGVVDIKDPDSLDFLESILVSKVSVKVSIVGEKVSVARTYKQTQSNLARAMLHSEFFSQQERIKSDQKTASDDWDRVVRVGDEVVQIEED